MAKELFLCIASALVVASKPAIAQTKGSCDSAQKYAEDHEKAGQVFAVNAAGSWQAFTFDALAKQSHKTPVYAWAEVWPPRSGFRIVSTTLTSPSGDWINRMDYCYRSNGTLLRYQSELSTFSGEVRRIRIRYFDTHGELNPPFTIAFDLKTAEPLRDPEYMDQQDEIYPTLSGLPFKGIKQ